MFAHTDRKRQRQREKKREETNGGKQQNWQPREEYMGGFLHYYTILATFL